MSEHEGRGVMSSELEDAQWDAAYWKHCALTCGRFWLTGWNWRVYLGNDEYFRRTVVIGPLVIALWRLPECRDEIADAQAAMDDLWEEMDS